MYTYCFFLAFKDLESTIRAAPEVITNWSNVNLPDDKQHTQSRNSSENNEMFERAIKDLKRESKELEDKRSNFSVTCFQPQDKGIEKGNYVPFILGFWILFN